MRGYGVLEAVDNAAVELQGSGAFGVSTVIFYKLHLLMDQLQES